MTQPIIRRTKKPDNEAPKPQEGHSDSKATSGATAAGDLRGRAKPVPAAPPIIHDVALRADRTNQPRQGESFGTEFLDNVAHQMVAPLQSIEMHCTNILNGDVPADRHNARLKEVIGHTKILCELARRMRFLHELVTGKVIDTELLDFRQVVTAWIDGFNNYLPATQGRGIDVDIDLAMNKLPVVIASRLAVHQVVMNLFDNAIKYGKPHTKIRIAARREPPYIVNEFSHAAGIPLTQLAVSKMFERGFRAEEAKAISGSGAGIGMWISKKLMMAMQGDLRAIPTNADGVTKFVLKWRVAP